MAQFPHTHAHLHRPSDSETATAQHWLSTFQHLAKDLRVDIVVGTIVERAVDAESGQPLSRQVEIESDQTGERRTETRPVLENVSTYIDWNGEIIGRYKKRNLWWPEKDYLCAGDEEHQVFDTRFGKVGILVCTFPFPGSSLARVTDLGPTAGWDLAWPRAFEPLLLRGADMIIAPTYWTGTDGGPEGMKHNPTSETDFLQVLVKTRAWDNECAILVRLTPFLLAVRAVNGTLTRSRTRSAVLQRRRADVVVAWRPVRQRGRPDRLLPSLRPFQGRDRQRSESAATAPLPAKDH